MTRCLCLALLLTVASSIAQEQVDKADAQAKGAAALTRLTMRVRVTKAVPEPAAVRIQWRRGGEGLGGNVVRSSFLGAGDEQKIPFGAWTGWFALRTITGGGRGWDFPTIVVEGVSGGAGAKGKAAVPKQSDVLADLDDAPKAAAAANAKGAPVTLSDIVVEFEFADGGKVFHRFTETAPKGATVGFAFPGSALGDKVTPEFIAQLNGLSTHARLRRERLEALFKEPAPMPQRFALIGHLGGYGEGVPGKGGGSGYGVRHCNPAILVDECRTLQMLGVNSLVGSLRFADAAGFGSKFRQVYWGGPGSGSPMNMLQGNSKVVVDACPFDPALPPLMAESTKRAIEEHRAAKAKESWALWTDEIGVFAKEHIARCDRCAEKFRAYVQAQKLTPVQLGAATWDEVKPFDIWGAPAEGAKAGKGKARPVAAGPQTPADALRAYYTSRFMTHATAQVFPEAARQFKAAGIPLYAMQGPTPSWSGSSLDWHEFYDHGANTAFVFETSNRDARVWQWESYLADIGRGIAVRHQMPMGCLVKPHRGAPAQRMLTVIARGTRVVEWYTYGPDYSKGDSFSQSPELLEQVARAARFLGQAEEYLYGAKHAGQPEVAFVTPRSSEIWGRSGGLNGTAFENAKWVYLALAHAHVPVDILSEQQLAEGKLERYKAIYIPGPNLRRDAAAQVKTWVREGGRLWTDALGLSRDEADQPSAAMDELLGLKDRVLERWGSVPLYGATSLGALVETNAPAHAAFGEAQKALVARIGREPLKPTTAEVVAHFADKQPAVTRNRFGKGEVTVVGCWSGLSYSAQVRRADFDMRADFTPGLREFIAAPALAAKAYRPAVPAEALVEAVALDNAGRRSVALINWSYERKAGEAGKGRLQTAEKLRVELAGMGAVKSARSLIHGPLPLANGAVVVPSLAEIDLLVLE